MTASQVLIDRIKTNLSNIPDIADQAIKTYEDNEIGASPEIHIVEQGNEAEYETTKDNERIYIYVIRLFLERSQVGADRSEQNLRAIRDQIIDQIDKDPYFSGISLPTGYTMVNVFAAPMSMGYMDNRGSLLRMAEVKVRIRISVDTLSV